MDRSSVTEPKAGHPILHLQMLHSKVSFSYLMHVPPASCSDFVLDSVCSLRSHMAVSPMD